MSLQIAVIGCGMIGREHIERIQNRIRGAQVVAVCDVFEDGAKKAAQIAGEGTKVYTDFHQAINDPDVNAVVVTTPGAFHKDPIIAAIQAGKPVFSEKPLANTAEDCKAVVDAEMASGKHLVQVGFMRRYDRGYRQVKELLDSGKFGAPMVLKCTHRADGVAPDYTTSMAVTDTAIHEIDVLPWLINDEWDEVQCIMPKSSSKAHEGLKDPQIMIMKTKGGIVTVLEVNVNCGFGYDINCEVVCENGVVNLPCPSFPTVRYANQVSTKIEDNWILRFIDSYDIEIEGAQVEQVTDTNGLPAVKVSFADGILFDFNSTTLSNESKARLRELAEILRDDTTTDIAIIGHTDKAGTYEVNMKFSKNRAYAVENYLQDCGVSPAQFKQVTGVGYNEYDESLTAAENRRVDIYMYASEEMIQQAEAQN